MIASWALAVSAVFAVFAVPPAAGSGRTWVVDAAGGGDYVDIQSAIDAASVGDLIVVESGVYAGFDLHKRLTVQARTDFTVDSTISIHNVGAGPGAAALIGARGVPDDEPFLVISACLGDVVIENCTLELGYIGEDPFQILDCAHVTLTNCGSGTTTWNLYGLRAILVVERSVVSGTGLALRGADGIPGSDAQGALYAADSTVILAASSLRGGDGGDGDTYGVRPGDGAAAIVAYDSTLQVIGDATGSIQGGDAGCTYYPFGCSCCAPFGAAGNGATLSNSKLLISRVTIAGGDGLPDGLPSSGGTLTRDDLRPFFTLAPALALGATTTLTVDAAQTGHALLLLSDQGTVDSAGPNWVGPPLFVGPGSAYVVVDLGPSDGAGDWDLPLDVPDDPALLGFTYHSQIAHFADTGALYLTNDVVRTVGD